MKSILIIGKVWPEPSSSAAGSRMMQLIDFFKRQSFKINFASAAQHSPYSEKLNDQNVITSQIDLNSDSFDVFIKELNPTIILYDRYTTEEQFGWRVSENCPQTIRILDTEDLHFLRAARQDAFNKNKNLHPGDIHTAMCKREIAAIYRCDLSLIISPYEIELLKKEFKIDEALLFYLPLLFDKSNSINNSNLIKQKTFSERQDFISIGNFLHEPNKDAVIFLKQAIWPKIKQVLPHAQLLVYGAYAPEQILQMQDKKQGFIIKGRAEDANDVVGDAKVLLAPLRFGAGIKGKLFEAMLNGTPSVTTSIGSEGMCGETVAKNDPNFSDKIYFPKSNTENDWPGKVANGVDSFVQAAAQLYSDEAAWNQAQKSGKEFLHLFFDKVTFESQLSDTIEILERNLQAHRSNNFIGQMLMHHTSQGTKYMSQWIELKNKIQKQAEQTTGYNQDKG